MPIPRIRTKSIASAVEPRRDGLRILATRYLPRATPRDRYDVWMPNLGPSERLLKSFQAGKIAWPEFAVRYKAQLFAPAPLDAENPSIKNHGQKFTLRLLKQLARGHPVTLLCACAESEPHCHRHLLKKVLDSAAI